MTWKSQEQWLLELGFSIEIVLFATNYLILGQGGQNRFGIQARDRQQGARCAAGLLAPLLPPLQKAAICASDRGLAFEDMTNLL
jgi:hypothetical protein